MVHNKDSRIVGVVLCLFTAVLMVCPGCSDSESRASGQEIMKAVDQARRLCDKAASQLGVAPAEVNKDAFDSLVQAEKALTGAMSANADAPASTIAIAKNMLANVLSAKAGCKEAESRIARAVFLQAIDNSSLSIAVVNSQVVQIDYFNAMVALDEEKIKEVVSGTKAEILELNGKIKTRQDVLDGKTIERDRLRDKSSQLSLKAGQLRSESDLASGKKALALFKEFDAAQSQATDLLSQVLRLENEMESLSLEISGLKGQVDAATQQQELARKALALESRKKADSDRQKSLYEVTATMNAARKTVETDLVNIAVACDQMSKADKASGEFFEDAAKAIQGSISAQTGVRPGEGVLASQAAALASAADIKGRAILLSGKAHNLADKVSELWGKQSWPVPAEVEKLGKYVSEEDRKKLYNNAEGQYDKAIKLYNKAVSAASSQNKWIYQSAQASAHYRALKLTGKDSHLTKAEDLIGKALDGRRESPYLQEAVRLEKLILEAAKASAQK